MTLRDTMADNNAPAADGTDVLRERHMSVMAEIPDTKTQQVLDIIHGLNINSLAGLRKFARHASMQRRAAADGLEQRYIDAIIREYGLESQKKKKKKAPTAQGPSDNNTLTDVVANESADMVAKKGQRGSVRLATENKKTGVKKLLGRVKSKGSSTPVAAATGEPDAEQVVKRGLNDEVTGKPLEPKLTKLQLLQQKQRKANRASAKTSSRAGSSSSIGSVRSAMASIRNLPVRAVDGVVGGVDAMWMNVNNSVPK